MRTRAQVIRAVKDVKRRLDGAFTGFVVAVIALPSTTINRRKLELQQVDVVEAKNLCDFIEQRRHTLEQDVIDRISTKLSPLVNERRKSSDVVLELEP